MDRDLMLKLVRDLVEIESPTYSSGVLAVSERMARELEALGGAVRLFEGAHLRADFPGREPPLLLIGHADTVWPLGTIASMPFRVEEGLAYGPGVYDMKACLVVLVEAIRLAGPARRALRVFLTADEEMASVTGRPMLETAASGAAAALVVEPPTSSGDLKTARKGLGRFRVSITGRSAHAGDRQKGASAIEELAHQILAAEALNDPERGISINVGVVRGGTAENVVPAEAEAQIDVRFADAAEREPLERALGSLAPKIPGTALRLDGGWTRPPLQRSRGSAALFARAREVGLTLGLDLREASASGGSDGNLVAPLGVPVLDGLGAEGGGAHAPDEHVVVASLPVRARLLAGLLQNPGL